MLASLFSTPILLYFVLPSVAIGIFVSSIRNKTVADNHRKIIKAARLAAALVFIENAIYTIYRITTSASSTAIVGIIDIPVGGLVLGLLAFITTWAIATLWFGEISRTKKVAAILTLIMFGLIALAQGYSSFLITKVKTSNDQNELLQIYEKLWVQYNPTILSTIAANEKTRPDILSILALDTRESIQSRAVGNPSTPVLTLISLYENQTAALYDLAVNPSLPINILIEISKSQDETAKSNLTYNPNLPAEVLCELGKASADSQQFNIVASSAQSNIRARNIQCP